MGQFDFSVPLTRVRFKELNNDLFRKTMGPVKKAMEHAGLEKRQIDEIVLVGGSTQITKYVNWSVLEFLATTDNQKASLAFTS
ncbi:hypothetical protein L1987_15250 [Smallanthus sonchifolius]|uniref:Uncharacterized protein n=1 Tax=Smallanthus sonchifolius TaxID=185202 RepID=A0ACB9J6L4_9ASTR|nr:hypothetical protein L1987_15250 [Smallanthus sonchifolius]